MKTLNTKNIRFFFTVIILAFKANVGANIFLWDNQLGLTPVKNCKAEVSHEMPFLITASENKKDKRYEYLRNYLGIKQSNFASGSLAKLIDGKKKNNYTKIEAIGINHIEGLNQNKWFTQKGDSGYLYNKSTSPIEDHVIKVNDQKDVNYLIISQSIGYHYLICDKRKYYIFRNYKSLEDGAPESLVAISENETSIFKNIETLSIDSITNPLLKNFAVENEGSGVAPGNYVEEDEVKSIDDEIAEILEIEHNPKSNNIDDIIIPQQDGLEDSKEVEISVQEENVLCIPNQKINIRDENLENILFQAISGEVVQVFQTFDDKAELKQDINGIEYTFVKIKFPNREEKDQNIGRVAKRFILPKSKCKYIPNERETLDKTKLNITGLSDKMCCDFPTIKKVTHPYTSGMRRFNANRGNGTRKHAACDLYRVKNEAIVSVAPGKVIRDHYYFYQGTYAIEVEHQGGFIVRYGEITGKKVDGMKIGKSVNMGDRLGYVGVVNSNCCLPMLHFEMYKGDKKGPLSVDGNKYQRRSDLMDPTFYLQKWEGMTFNE